LRKGMGGMSRRGRMRARGWSEGRYLHREIAYGPGHRRQDFRDLGDREEVDENGQRPNFPGLCLVVVVISAHVAEGARRETLD
jgi:hypothetical protein